jgi:hypothetical protein
MQQYLDCTQINNNKKRAIIGFDTVYNWIRLIVRFDVEEISLLLQTGLADPVINDEFEFHS